MRSEDRANTYAAYWNGRASVHRVAPYPARGIRASGWRVYVNNFGIAGGGGEVIDHVESVLGEPAHDATGEVVYAAPNWYGTAEVMFFDCDVAGEPI